MNKKALSHIVIVIITIASLFVVAFSAPNSEADNSLQVHYGWHGFAGNSSIYMSTGIINPINPTNFANAAPSR